MCGWGQSLVFQWVYFCNMVILINIYLIGKVEGMISSRVCSSRVHLSLSEHPFMQRELDQLLHFRDQCVTVLQRFITGVFFKRHHK